MSLTLRDVAHRANVSPSTVSRALNNYPHVDESTRTAVWQAAEELGYPLASLRRLNQARRTVLLLTRFQHQSPLQETWAGIERAIALGAQSVFEPTGITTRVQHTTMDPEEAHSYAADAALAGLILMGGVLNCDFVRNLSRLNVPFVLAGARVATMDVNCVTADYRTGAEQAVAHLVARGYGRIGLVNGPPTTTSSADKYQGYRLGLELAGLDHVPARVCQADFTPESGHDSTQALLSAAPDVDAIVYADDTMALGGLHALKELGLRIPEDVAITGFYNYELARYTDPPLTTVGFDMHGMGVIAAHRLQMLSTPAGDEAWTIVLATELVVRRST